METISRTTNQVRRSVATVVGGEDVTYLVHHPYLVDKICRISEDYGLVPVSKGLMRSSEGNTLMVEVWRGATVLRGRWCRLVADHFLLESNTDAAQFFAEEEG